MDTLDYITRIYHLFRKPGGREAYFKAAGLRLYKMREVECVIESLGEYITNGEAPEHSEWCILEAAEKHVLEATAKLLEEQS